MMGSTHKVGGLLASTAIARVYCSPDILKTGISSVGLLFGSILGSMLCDIDKKESSIGRLLWFISWPIYLFRLIIKLIEALSGGRVNKVFRKLDRAMGHRGLAHSFITWVMLSGCFYLLYKLSVPRLPLIVGLAAGPFLLGVSIGMMTHIILDMMSSGGVAIFSPFSDRKIKIADIAVGGFFEGGIRILMTLGSAAIGYSVIIGYIGTWRF